MPIRALTESDIRTQRSLAIAARCLALLIPPLALAAAIAGDRFGLTDGFLGAIAVGIAVVVSILLWHAQHAQFHAALRSYTLRHNGAVCLTCFYPTSDHDQPTFRCHECGSLWRTDSVRDWAHDEHRPRWLTPLPLEKQTLWDLPVLNVLWRVVMFPGKRAVAAAFVALAVSMAIIFTNAYTDAIGSFAYAVSMITGQVLTYWLVTKQFFSHRRLMRDAAGRAGLVCTDCQSHVHRIAGTNEIFCDACKLRWPMHEYAQHILNHTTKNP